MKLFKTTDEKFEELGFTKVEETDGFVRYSKYISEHNYTQYIDLCRKQNGRNLIHSYDPKLPDKKGIGHTAVGISMYEAKLCIKKMKEKGWRIQKK